VKTSKRKTKAATVRRLSARKSTASVSGVEINVQNSARVRTATI
jgi:hypothetical protein